MGNYKQTKVYKSLSKIECEECHHKGRDVRAIMIGKFRSKMLCKNCIWRKWDSLP